MVSSMPHMNSPCTVGGGPGEAFGMHRMLPLGPPAGLYVQAPPANTPVPVIEPGTKVVLPGRMSVTVTLIALLGPLFSTFNR